MLDEKTIIQTIKQLMKSPNMSSRLRYKLRDAIDPEVYIVSWCIEDMEHLAKENEEDGEVLYNRDMFPFALERAMETHDAAYGISWETLAFYLDEYCLIK